jgi:hypothetical protein
MYILLPLLSDNCIRLGRSQAEEATKQLCRCHTTPSQSSSYHPAPLTTFHEPVAPRGSAQYCCSLPAAPDFEVFAPLANVTIVDERLIRWPRIRSPWLGWLDSLTAQSRVAAGVCGTVYSPCGWLQKQSVTTKLVPQSRTREAFKVRYRTSWYSW